MADLTLVDLMDPLAGRVTQYHVEKSTPSAGLGKGAGSSIAPGKEERSLQLHDNAGGRRWQMLGLDQLVM